MSNMVHCRGCGMPLHAEALSCPSCGAPQHTSPPKLHGSPALAVISVGLGALALFGILAASTPVNHDEIVGYLLFAVISMVCGVLSLTGHKPGRNAAVVGLILAGISGLICIANL